MRKNLILAIIAFMLILASFNFGKQQVPIIIVLPPTEEESYLMGILDGCFSILGWLTSELDLSFTEDSATDVCQNLVNHAKNAEWYKHHSSLDIQLDY